VEEGVDDGVRAATLEECVDGGVEGQPLADAEVELVGFFEVGEDEEVVPGGEVFDGRDSVGEGVGLGEEESFAALFGGG
jgi:hypothetical protein